MTRSEIIRCIKNCDAVIKAFPKGKKLCCCSLNLKILEDQVFSGRALPGSNCELFLMECAGKILMKFCDLGGKRDKKLLKVVPWDEVTNRKAVDQFKLREFSGELRVLSGNDNEMDISEDYDIRVEAPKRYFEVIKI